ncbi:MAG: hypothetical protein ACYTBZ_29605 [Planctomycetota bacterium]|jgi:hypothetical protein
MKRQVLCAALVILSAIGGAARATTYYVDGATGSDAYDGLAAVWDGNSGPKEHIQAAIDAAAPSGDDINVAPLHTVPPFMYEENLIVDKDVDIHSSDVNNPHHTTIDGWLGIGNRLPAVTFENCGPGAKLRGFTVTGAWAEYGGGIECINSSPTILKCIIEYNWADFYGGGIDIDGSGPGGTDANIIDCNINNNQAAYGGGISTYFRIVRPGLVSAKSRATAPKTLAASG